MKTAMPIVEHPGRPADLKFSGFSLWIERRQFPDSTDTDDGNWLQVRACYRSSGAMVNVCGPIIQTNDIRGFAAQCEVMHATLSGTAELAPHEPNLEITLSASKRGPAL
ncbi:MAG: hypothetical protein M3N19_11640 [Candidatus Eremiobacteraeota bacterium]|nr:hypothetical protein [Candidatus Eremiobacteraeota bacterium]